MKKILVTGALGHIGSRFIHKIRLGDYEKVILFDNLSSQRYCSLFNLPTNVPFHFIEGDVCTTDLSKYFKDIDIVIHLAAITDAAGSFEIQDQVEKVNFEGTEKVAKACIGYGCKMVFLSTTSVYGTQEKIVNESCTEEELLPQSPYAKSKLKAENLLREMGKKDDLKFVICRFGTIYGTSIGMRFHTAINKFCWQACMGKPITVWRTALHQKRPYLDLSDAICAIKFIIEGDHFDNRIYNVLTNNATVNQIVEIIRTNIPDAEIKFVNTRIMNQLSYEVSNQKIKSLGFEFTGDLEKGISDTLGLIKGASLGRRNKAR